MSKPDQKNTKLKIKIVVVFLIVLGLILWGFFYKRHLIAKSIKPKQPPVMTVDFTKVKTKKWSQQVKAIGTVRAVHGITLKAQVAGRLVKSLVKPGESVNAKQLLYVIYPDGLAASLSQAKADLAAKKTQYNRNLNVYKKVGNAGVSKQTLEDSKSAYFQAKAEVEQALAQRSLANITAEIPGVLGLTPLKVGDYLNIGQVVNTLIPDHGREVYFPVPASLASSINIGDSIEYTYLSGIDQKMHKATGEVLAKDTIANEQSRMQMIHGDFDLNNGSEDNLNILPGSYVEVIVSTEKPKTVMVLPQVAIMGGPYGHYVYQVINGKAIRKVIKLGVRREDLVEIKSGVSIGDTIILNGQNKILYEGISVTNKGAIKPEKVSY